MKSRLFPFFVENKVLIGVNLLGLYLFARMAEYVIEQESVLLIDRWISLQMDTLHTPLFDTMMVALTNLNSGMGILVFSVVLMLFLAYQKWYIDLWFYLVSVIGANAAYVIIKMIVQRLRPDSDLLFLSTYSFPSGHATMATAIATVLYFIFSPRVDRVRAKVFLIVISLSWIVVISFSRIYLDVHWVSDVIAGIGLGFFWVTFVVLIRRFIYTV